MRSSKMNLKRTTWIFAAIAVGTILVNMVAFNAKALDSGGKTALIKNCVSNGSVYAYATTCGTGSGNCAPTNCPAPPQE